MVVDTSALIAFLLNEKHASWIQSKMEEVEGDLCMSTVNLCECCIILADRKQTSQEKIKKIIQELPIQYIAPSVEDSLMAAEARLSLPLNLGDCFAYALAKSRNAAILTLDEDFLKTDLTVFHAK